MPRRLRSCSHWPAKLLTRASERGSASIRRTCCDSNVGLRESTLDREVHQLVVGDGAPEKEREPRGQLDVRHAVRRPRTQAGGLALGTEHEGRAREDAPQDEADTGAEVAARALLLVEA